ncbi:hypothetical protein [Vineibacter terrae]|uniref:hypothetical protein n=1 Tax=Vineibacter terrae TaxID=2586908 RepID=UPI002E321F19|nr:hypothetical protein [Vineibacter terrae]HEX2884902.1 hypothetical protein [Vineibacter terrae]
MNPGYRADDRPPADLKKDNGFKPWYEITDAAVLRQLMEFVAGTRTWANCSFKPLCEKYRFDFPPSTTSPMGKGAQVLTVTPATFHEWIIRSKDRGPSVSTAPEETCGGYASGRWVYRVNSDDLDVYTWSVAVPGSNVATNARTPSPCMNSNNLAVATKLAIKGNFGVKELSYLYAVTPDQISVYKDPQGNVVHGAPLVSTY